MMEKNDIAILVKRLNEASDAYYNGGEPIMDDAEFDELMDRLKKAEAETGIVLSNSPTRQVGAVAIGDKVQHDQDHPMLSLDKCHTVQELIDFAGDDDCYLSIKCDGLSTRLCYKCTDGKTAHLVSAATRGDGNNGSNIFEHIHYYDNVPLTIPYDGDFIIDGESIILDNDFRGILKTEPQYKNSRNLASGTLANQDMNIVKQRHMKFIAWRVINGWNLCDDNFEKLKMAEHIGFTTVPSWLYSEEHVDELLHTLRRTAAEKGIPMDGAVIAKCSTKLSESMGKTDKFFRHSLAYKFEDEVYPTKLMDITWSVGKTNKITPVARFLPVDIDGSTVSRASLCNISIIEKLGLTKGCTCYVRKSNCIIPQIFSCDNDGVAPFVPPMMCPSCGAITKIVQDNESKILVCSNPECCGSLLGKLVHAVSKQALNIDGLSEATLSFLIDKGWISSVKDIYYLSNHRFEWIGCEGFGEKSVGNLLDAIEFSRTTTLDRFLCAISIDGVGASASKTISNYFRGDFNAFNSSWSNGFDYTQLADIGATTAKNIDIYMTNHHEEVYALSQEMQFTISKTNIVKNNPFVNKTIVVTGSLIHFTRDTINAKIAEIGAKTAGSVSKKTDYLLTNDASGSSKYRKAVELNIPVITEDQFLKEIGE